MKSTIKIGRDENDKPAIIIRAVNDSEDLRDETLIRFLRLGEGAVNFCFIECVGASSLHDSPENRNSIWHIRPVSTVEELEELKKRVEETIRVLQSNVGAPTAIIR